MQLLAYPDVDFATINRLSPDFAGIEPEIEQQLSREALYANYLERQDRDVALLRKDEAQLIPEDFDYDPLDGLSNELKSKLCRIRPANLAQAARIDGMTPAALTLILSRLKRASGRKSA
jgi:tRNA uridine 5-carboxymethylaminomethyl modification enzyme